MDVITADIGRSLVPDSLRVPKDSDNDDDDNDDVDDVVVQEIGSDIDDRGDFDEVYDKIEDEGEAVVEEVDCKQSLFCSKIPAGGAARKRVRYSSREPRAASSVGGRVSEERRLCMGFRSEHFEQYITTN